jgi:hypothetical protein
MQLQRIVSVIRKFYGISCISSVFGLWKQVLQWTWSRISTLFSGRTVVWEACVVSLTAQPCSPHLQESCRVALPFMGFPWDSAAAGDKRHWSLTSWVGGGESCETTANTDLRPSGIERKGEAILCHGEGCVSRHTWQMECSSYAACRSVQHNFGRCCMESWG